MSTSAGSLRRSVVLLLTVAAFALRAWGMNAQSLWYDEVGSMKVVATPVAELATALDAGNVEPTTWLSMAYWALLKGVVAVSPLANGDATVRLSSVVLGTATVPALAWALQPCLPAGAVLAATAALTVSPFHVWYSQEVRPYVLLILVVTLAIGAYVRARVVGGWSWWSAVSVLVTIALYTHPIAIALPVVLGISLLTDARGDVRRAVPGLLALVVAGIAFVPALLLIRAHGANNPADARGVGWFDVPYVVYAYAVGFSWGPSTTELHVDRAAALARTFPAVASAGLVFGALAFRGARALRLLATPARVLLCTWLVLPLALAFAIAALTANPLNARYGIVSFPAFVALLGLGAADVPRWLPTFLATAALTISLAARADLALDARYAKEDCRSLATALRSEATPDDLVVVNASYMAIAVRYYYPGPAEVVPYPRVEVDRTIDPAQAANELAPLLADHRRVWLVASRTFHGDRTGVLPGVIGRGRVADLTLTFPGVVATRWVRPATP